MLSNPCADDHSSPRSPRHVLDLCQSYLYRRTAVHYPSIDLLTLASISAKGHEYFTGTLFPSHKCSVQNDIYHHLLWSLRLTEACPDILRSSAWSDSVVRDMLPLGNLTLNCNVSADMCYSCCSRHTSKKPNSYGESDGPTMRALTCLTSTSRHATASAGLHQLCLLHASP